MRSVIEIFLCIESPDQDYTRATSRNQSREPKEFSSMIKSKKLH